jgi:hypothetical protein
MKCRRLSIAGLMALILFAAVAFASLKHPSSLLASALFTADAIVMCVAVMGAAFHPGHRRRPWAGFALFGGVYLGSAFAWPSLGPPAILPAWGLAYLDTQISTSGPKVAVGYYEPYTLLSFPTIPEINPASVPRFQIGHTLMALVAGAFGAGIALCFGPSRGGADRSRSDCP